MTKCERGPVRAVALSAICAALAGCGGGGTIVSSIPYEGPVTQADYVGKTFPVYFLVGEAGDRPGKVLAAKGTITYNTDDTVTVRLPGRAPVVFSPTATSGGVTSYEADGSGGLMRFAEVRDFSNPNTTAFRIVSSPPNPPPETFFLGGFGFETPAADRQPLPTATYNTAGAVFLTTPGSADFLPVAGDGTLTANFGAGTISGTLLTTDLFEVNLVGDPTTEDLLELTFLLQNGRITPSGFTGGVTATAQINEDGGGPRLLTGTVSGGSAEGAFFGEEAAAVAGMFEGDLALSDGGSPLVDFEAAGFVSGAKSP